MILCELLRFRQGKSPNECIGYTHMRVTKRENLTGFKHPMTCLGLPDNR